MGQTIRILDNPLSLFQLKKATIAVTEMRGRTVCGSRLQTDYASHECRNAFFDHCKKSGMDVRERAKPWEQEQNGPTTERRWALGYSLYLKKQTSVLREAIGAERVNCYNGWTNKVMC